MEIIIPGDLEKARKKNLRPLQFTCPDCECIFVAGNNEYEWGSQLEPGPYATCPCCGRKNVDYKSLYADAISAIQRYDGHFDV